MHPTILAKRKAEAIGKLVAAAAALTEMHKLNPALVAGLQPVGIKDPAVRDLMLLEAVAEVLMAMGTQTGAAPATGVSAETAAGEPPADERSARSRSRKS